MTFYENLVTQTQMNYSSYYHIYAQGQTPYRLSERKPLPYNDQIDALLKAIDEAECIVVGGASGLSAAGGGDFYYSASESYKEYFKPFWQKYHFNGAFDGMGYRFPSREEYWGYLATFLSTTQNSPIRKPYLDLDALLSGKDFFILTTNQDTQFVKLYPEKKVAEIQGDHRFFQCSKCCTDYIWDSVEPVRQMVESMHGGTTVDPALIPHCPHCGVEAFPWVRGYGNFLTESRYEAEYGKISKYILEHQDKKIFFLELGVGRLTPMFIQEPFWNLTLALEKAQYISVNDRYNFLPKQIEDRGMVIVSDIAKVLRDARERKDERAAC